MREKAKKVMESRSWLLAPASLGGLRSQEGGGKSRRERQRAPKLGGGLVVALGVFRHHTGVGVLPVRSAASTATGLGGSRCLPHTAQGDAGSWGLPKHCGAPQQEGPTRRGCTLGYTAGSWAGASSHPSTIPTLSCFTIPLPRVSCTEALMPLCHLGAATTKAAAGPQHPHGCSSPARS